MRKEIIGILLVFVVVFILISLLSYSPFDPSIHNARAAGRIHNLFGVFGANLSGLLIGIFGMGAFWIPVIILLISLHILGEHPPRTHWVTAAGGLLLIVATASLMTLSQNSFVLFGHRFSSGGVVGHLLKKFLVEYLNKPGGTIILALIWMIGFMLATGFSLIRFVKGAGRFARFTLDRLKNLFIKLKEQRGKARKRSKLKDVLIEKHQRKVKINTADAKPLIVVPVPKQEKFDFMETDAGYAFPSINFLDEIESRPVSTDNENLQAQSRLLEKKLEDFGIQGRVITVSPGPVITTFEYEPAPGVKINRIVTLTDDLALALRAISVRIVAPIPGKPVIGIEIPNATREVVRFREVVSSSAFIKSKSKLTVCLGKDIVGNSVMGELDKMPHLLIAGATGTGKSVALNTMICSILYKARPEETKFIMVDPKRIELSCYDGIPHLITPVVTDVKKATNALFWAVREMERRYELLSELKARNIAQYNQKTLRNKKEAQDPAHEWLPYIVIIIDELADLMMVASRDVEFALTRLAQMARASGIHLILATQRPSVNVLTGVIKANFPTRLSFQVSSKTDSRTIIDANGAESLLGNGDMLFLPPGTGKLQRIHGAYISEVEITRITEFLKAQKPPEYIKEVIEKPEEDLVEGGDTEYDERYDDAVALVTRTRQASISMVQRHLRIGYNRAARIIEVMEKEGIVGPADGSKPREVLVRGYDEGKA
ncbi:MAG: DNA translocase FtsK 4TM domain-containing protein [Desulfobacterales bacterium]|nr:DNA translocase FtsK 4TM domain-containing protein [Desulfobacterales bacterium]